ncbi:MAG: ATP-binding cassette domain-containing protein [Treponema sp.]|nr:ATP-binding cassette domain-containing protein [Treponema sp.]
MRDVSIRLVKGEILGVVGESGSGKTSLMRALYIWTGSPRWGSITWNVTAKVKKIFFP